MSVRLVEDVSDDTYALDGLTLTLTPALTWLGHQACWEMNGHLKEPVDLTRVTRNVITEYGPVKMLERTDSAPPEGPSAAARADVPPRQRARTGARPVGLRPGLVQAGPAGPDCLDLSGRGSR
ncbi:hypothetical protein [Streptomyces spinosus]|uniref:hypothetical protein n=1 Tax=Streptomyces spinosus TaxID=2872623 RepID=UPI001CEC2313|nr:hypothetical protein [Streptomyces spinosus]